MKLKLIFLVIILFMMGSCTVPLSVHNSPYNTSSEVRNKQVDAYKRVHKKRKANKKFHNKNNKRINKLQNSPWWGN